MGMCRCIKCGNQFDSRDDMGDTLYPGYKGDSWACFSCHEKEHDKEDEPREEAFVYDQDKMFPFATNPHTITD